MKLGLGLGINKGGYVETAPPYFAMTIDTTRSGVSNNNQFQFTGAVGQYDVDAVQNDVIVQSYTGLVGQKTITLPSAGIYQVRVKPMVTNPFNRVIYKGTSDRRKILSIDSFGTDVNWSSFKDSFASTVNSTDIKDVIHNGQNVTNFNLSFENIAISSLPKGFLDSCVNATKFNFAFQFNYNLHELPEGLFNKCKDANNFVNCFRGTTLTTETLSRLYIELSITNTKNNVSFNGGDGFYDPNFSFTVNGVTKTTGQARQDLVNRGWTLTDAGSI